MIRNLRRTTFQLLGALAIATVLLVMSACANPLATTNTTGDKNTGGFSLNFGSSPRTINPLNPAEYALTSYQVTGLGPNGATFDSGSITNATYSKSGLFPGSWTITMKGNNSYGHTISEAAVPLTVISNQVTARSVSLLRASGNGTIEVKLIWQTPGEFDAISGTITPVGGDPQDVSFTIDAATTSATYSGVLPAGNYTLKLSLAKNSLDKERLVEAAQIFDGYTSSAIIDRSITGLFNYATNNPVYAVDFGGAANKQVTISGAASKQVFLVKANTTNGTISSLNSGAAASTQERLAYTMPRQAQAEQFIPASGRLVSYDNAAATAFNANPPPFDRGSQSRNLPGLGQNQAIIYGGASSYVVNVSTKYFWVQNASGVWVQIKTTLRASGNYCYIWVADVNYNTGSAVDNDNLLTNGQAIALRDKFDGSAVNSYSDGIFKNVTNIFGYEYGGGPLGSGGRDADQHVSVLVYDIDYDYVPTQGGGVLGFFWAKDLYTQAVLDSDNSGLKTNFAEMFYIDSHFTDKLPGVITSTLAHEYQHMINFNQKTIINNVISNTWFNEMCSMVAEDLVLANIGLNPASDGAQSRYPEFLYHYPESGVSDWLSGNDLLKSYASAFSFGAYLARNYGGAQFFHSLATNNLTDEAAISAALAANGYSDSFTDAFAHYGEALVFTDKPAGSNVKTLKQGITQSLDGISYTAGAIDLALIQQYSMTAGGDVSGAYGIRTFTPTTQVALRPFGNSVHTQASWTNLTGDLVLSLSAPIDPRVKYYLMVK